MKTPWTMYTHRKKTVSDHHGLLPPTESSAPIAPRLAPMTPMTRPNALPMNQREAPGQLDHPEDDQDPAHGVEAGEDEALIVDEDVRTVQGADAVDDVDEARHQEQASP